MKMRIVSQPNDRMIRQDLRDGFCCMRNDGVKCNGTVKAYSIPFYGTFTLCLNHSEQLAKD